MKKQQKIVVGFRLMHSRHLLFCLCSCAVLAIPTGALALATPCVLWDVRFSNNGGEGMLACPEQWQTRRGTLEQKRAARRLELSKLQEERRRVIQNTVPSSAVSPLATMRLRAERDAEAFAPGLQTGKDANYAMLVKQKSDLQHAYEELTWISNYFDSDTNVVLQSRLKDLKVLIRLLDDITNRALRQPLSPADWARVARIQEGAVSAVDAFIDDADRGAPLFNDSLTYTPDLFPRSIREHLFVPLARRTKGYSETREQTCERLRTGTSLLRSQTAAGISTELYVSGCITQQEYCDSFSLTGAVKPKMCY